MKEISTRRKKVTWLLLIPVMFYWLPASGQSDPLYNQYLFNQGMINPAYTGSYNVFNATLTSRAQWTGIAGSPLTTTLNASTALVNETVGLGMLVTNDRLGALSNSDIQGSFSYKIKITPEGKLAFGVQAGVVSYRYDYNKLDLEVPDATLTQDARPNFTKPTVGAGMFYRTDYYYLGLSVPRLLNVSLDDGGTTNMIYKRQLYLSGGVVINKFENFKLKTTALVRVLEDQSYMDLTASILLAETVWAGISTRTFKSFGVHGMLEVGNMLRVGYYYELPSSGLFGSTFGTHELLISADLEAFQGQYALRRYF